MVLMAAGFFEYEACLDKNGRFHTVKAKSHLKSIGIDITDDLILHIKEHKSLPADDSDFDYSRCVDKNGKFHMGKAKSYLKSIDVDFDDDLIVYIKCFGFYGRYGIGIPPIGDIRKDVGLSQNRSILWDRVQYFKKLNIVFR